VKNNPYPVDPTGPITVGSIPDADLKRMIQATILAAAVDPPDYDGPIPCAFTCTCGHSSGLHDIRQGRIAHPCTECDCTYYLPPRWRIQGDN
jgi:hypothetical protein